TMHRPHPFRRHHADNVEKIIVISMIAQRRHQRRPLAVAARFYQRPSACIADPCLRQPVSYLGARMGWYYPRPRLRAPFKIVACHIAELESPASVHLGDMPDGAMQ